MLQAVVLGLVQGLTEFLPVSSSGHLVVVPYLLSWEQPPLSFDVALHVGTLVAVVAYFAGDLWYLATRSLGIGTVAPDEAGRARRTVALMLVGSLPAGVVGLALESQFEDAFSGPNAPRYVSYFLLATALILYLAEAIRRRRALRVLGEQARVGPATDVGRDESTVGFGDAVTIGIGQALAILPGISRSGTTIAAGMARGLSREGSARFSFLLSIPVIAGAGLLKVGDMGGAEGGYSGAETAVGMAVAALAGFWAIRYLLRLVATDDLRGFARYVALFGVLTFVGTLWIGPVSQV